MWNLLPLLRQSPQPRVLSVLNGGKEKLMCDEDIGLEHHWSTFAVINHTVTMTSLAFEHFAKTDEQIIFLHAAPGLVKTKIFAKLTAPESSGLIWSMVVALLRGLFAVFMLISGISTEESGERQAFHLTSDRYSPGAWRIDALSDQVSKSGVLKQYREHGWPEKVWEHTVCVFGNALATGSDSMPN